MLPKGCQQQVQQERHMLSNIACAVGAPTARGLCMHTSSTNRLLAHAQVPIKPYPATAAAWAPAHLAFKTPQLVLNGTGRARRSVHGWAAAAAAQCMHTHS